MLLKQLSIILICIAPTLGLSTAYYLDPVHGALTNDGSKDSPWPALQTVVEADMIETQQYAPIPYDPNNSLLVPKNPGAQIQAGDTLYLRSGLHGSFFFRGAFNADYITIMNEEGHQPILRDIRIKAGSHWRFEGLEISSEPYDEYLNYRFVFFETHSWHGPVHHAEIRNCHIYSTQDVSNWSEEDWLTKVSSGIYANGDSIHIENNTIENIGMGISLGGNGLRARHNEINNFAADGMRILGNDITVESNLIRNCIKIDENHDDGIQSFVTSNGSPIENVIIRGNTIINYDNSESPLRGTLQGIGCFDGPYINWLIENNVVMVDHWHGISLYGAYNCIIRNNTVVDPSPDITPGASWIRVADHKDGTPSEDCIVVNNICNRTTTGPETSTMHNLIIDSYALYDENFEYYSDSNLKLKETSAAIDAASDGHAPAFDLENTLRPQGVSSDIGAYEFVFTNTTTDNIALEQLHMFPNPVNEKLTVQGATTSIHVFDFLGKRIEVSLNSTTKSQILDMKNLASGIYFIGNKVDGFKKVLKVH